jgi:hypothetical protein
MKTSLQLEINDEASQLKVARIVQRAAEMTHCAFAAKQEAEEIAHTIASFMGEDNFGDQSVHERLNK